MMTQAKCHEILSMYDKVLTDLRLMLASQLTHERGNQVLELMAPGINHAIGMIPRMRTMLAEIDNLSGAYDPSHRFTAPMREKFMRWLGFLQACLYTSGIYTLEELKSHNKSDGDPFDPTA